MWQPVAGAMMRIATDWDSTDALPLYSGNNPGRHFAPEIMAHETAPNHSAELAFCSWTNTKSCLITGTWITIWRSWRLIPPNTYRIAFMRMNYARKSPRFNSPKADHEVYQP